MAKKIWVFDLEGQQHEVELQWSRWGGPGRISVDGQIADSWHRDVLIWQFPWVFQVPDERHFDVGGREALLRRQRLLFEELELLVDGNPVT